MTSFRLRVLAQTLPFLLIAPAVALAQTPPSRAEANAAVHASANPGAVHFTRQQLDQMVAPIALYPDQLLSQVLMAATYPQQVLDAAQWLQDQSHSALKGDELASALEPLPWDPSVKSLVAFPQVIQMMADHIEWTQALGTAFAADQAQIMARIQALRHLAMKSGKVKSVKHLNLREEGGMVVITSAEPDRIYVPVYNPVVVYGEAWPDRDYPPVYLPPPQGFVAETMEPGIEVSIGYSVVRPLWGWSRPDWRANRITIERDEYTRITRNAQLPSGNVWIHTGPVVEVQNLPHRGGAAAQVPAGTVAPAAVGRQGQAVQNRSQAPSGATAPNNTAAAPNPTQPATQPAQNSANTGKPGEPATGTTKPGEAASGTNKPNDKANANRAEQKTAPVTQPKTGTSAASPATPAAPAGNAARQEEKTRPGSHEGAARAPEHAPERAPEHANAPAAPAAKEAPAREGATRAPEHANTPAAKEGQARDHAAPASGASQEPARPPEREPTRPNAAQAPSAPAAPAPAQAERRGPEHQPAAPAAQAERPAAPHQPPAQGSSAPPAAAAPQSPKAAAPGHEPKREEEPKKEQH